MEDIDKPGAMRMGYISQILLCLYGGRFSYVAITNLRKYEAISQKAAEWSQAAQDHLDKTRKTQAAAALTMIISFTASSLMLGAGQYLPDWSSKVIGPIMLVGIIVARRYVKNYWAPYKDDQGKEVSVRVPLPKMEDYNEAEAMTERMLEIMSYLEYSWLATSFFAQVGYKL